MGQNHPEGQPRQVPPFTAPRWSKSAEGAGKGRGKKGIGRPGGPASDAAGLLFTFASLACTPGTPSGGSGLACGVRGCAPPPGEAPNLTKLTQGPPPPRFLREAEKERLQHASQPWKGCELGKGILTFLPVP